MNTLEDAFLDSLASRLVIEDTAEAKQATQVAAAGTVRPGAMEGEMRAIPQTKVEKALETAGVTLEQFGQMIDEFAPGTLNDLVGREVPVLGGLRLRDLVPFVGGTEEVENMLTGEVSTKEVGTPQALKMAGRGESLTTGTGLVTQLKPDVKLAVGEAIATAAPGVKPATKAVRKAVKKVTEKK
jgi:hypothetical protein